MRTPLFIGWFCIGLVAVRGVASAAETRELTFYVSTEGNDAWSGTAARPNAAKTDGPFATAERARDALRAAWKKRPGSRGTVKFMGGRYYLERGLEFVTDDSGTAESPVIYEAEAGQEVHLLGGRSVSGFEAVKDESILNRLSREARGKVMQADLKAQGITNLGQMKSRGFGRPTTPAGMELFFKNEPMTLARWPNRDYVKIAGFPNEQGFKDEHGGQMGKLTGGFTYEGDRPKGWKDPADLWVHGFWAWDWANSYEKVESLDTATRTIRTAPPHGLYGFRKGQRFYFLNVLEELDEPGEWFVDRKSGILYFWPPSPIEEGSVVVSTLEKPIIHLSRSSNVIIRGLILECTRGNAIEIDYGSNVRIEGCTIRNIGDYGVIIRNGMNHRVADCQIYQTGDGGVNVSGGDRKTLTACGHTIHNNHFHHIARWSRCYSPAILMAGVGIRVSNNLIHDHPHCAILFNGNEHVIELNEIHHVCMDTGDVGAIYTGRDYSYRGNIIRHNYIHETGGVGMGSMGVYMDDCVSGTTIVGNIFWKVHRAVFLGGGRDFKVENNVFVECKPGVELDGRGLSKSPVWHNMVYDFMKKRLEDVNWKQPPYRTRYPDMAALEKYYSTDDGIPPGNITVARNISVDGPFFVAQWGATKDMAQVKDNLVDQDPRFVDRAKGNFQVRGDSPAFKLGFQRIPVEKIGRQRGAQQK